jgi:lysozyme family protein
VLFDISINSGGSRAIKILQKVLFDKGYPIGEIDGVAGPNTFKYAKEFVDAQGGNVVNKICDKRAEFFKGIVAKDASQGVFLKGWLARNDTYRVA